MCRPSTKDGRAREEVSFSWKRGNSAFEKKRKKQKLFQLLLSSVVLWSKYQ